MDTHHYFTTLLNPIKPAIRAHNLRHGTAWDQLLGLKFYDYKVSGVITTTNNVANTVLSIRTLKSPKSLNPLQFQLKSSIYRKAIFFWKQCVGSRLLEETKTFTIANQ